MAAIQKKPTQTRLPSDIPGGWCYCHEPDPPEKTGETPPPRLPKGPATDSFPPEKDVSQPPKDADQNDSDKDHLP